MQVKLYVTTDDRRVVTKTLTDELVLENVILKNDEDAAAPHIILQNITEPFKYNYCYIPNLNRYFFLSEPVLMSGGRYDYTCTKDILMSLDDQLRELTGTVVRSVNKRNGYLVDDRYQALAYEQIVAKRFPNAMTNDSIILMTVG